MIEASLLIVFPQEGSEGQPHLRSFVMSVRIGSLSVSGESSTKKEAKKIAALKIVNQIIHGSDDVQSKVDLFVKQFEYEYHFRYFFSYTRSF